MYVCVGTMETGLDYRNALTRKGKAEDTGEDDMHVVVSIHNNMNERTWKKILEWEKIRRCVCGRVVVSGT